MRKYAFVDLPFLKYADGNDVFVKSRSGFTDDFGKSTPASDQLRQQYFHACLEKLRTHFGSDKIPVFLEWNTGECVRMDKGCVGHAIAANKIVGVEVSDRGIVTSVRLPALVASNTATKIQGQEF